MAFKKFGSNKPMGRPGVGHNDEDDIYSKALSKRHRQQVANKDQRGAGKKNHLVDQNALPEGMSIWYAKEGQHLVDIIPFKAGPDMPLDRETKEYVVTEEGDIDYLVDIDMHTRVGEQKVDFVCPGNYGLPCPICEFMNANRLEKEDWKKLKTSRRVVYLVWVHDTPEEEAKGLQIWPLAHFFMEKQLAVLTKMPQGGGIRQFSHPTKGFNISFSVRKENDMPVYEGHALWERPRPIPQRLLEKAIPLDSVLKLHPSYDDIAAAFLGTKKSLSGGAVGHSTGDDVPMGGSAPPDWYSEEENQQQKPAGSPFRKKTGNLFKRRR